MNNFEDLTEEEQHLHLLTLQQLSRQRAACGTRKNRRRQRMAPRDAEVTSDSEPEVAGDASTKESKAKVVTPANSTPQELVKVDPAEIGMSADYKYLYSGKEDKRGRFQWQTEIPEDLGKPAEDAESEKWAIIVRKVKVYNDPKKVLSLHSIVIQSPLLKDLLKEVLAGYPGVTVGLKRLEFSGRFEPLIHRWTQLKEAIVRLKFEKEGDSTDRFKHAKLVQDILSGETQLKEALVQLDLEGDSTNRLKHAELLHDLIADEFKDTIEASVDMKQQGVTTFDLLWTLFQPGSFVFSKKLQNQERVFRLHSCQYGKDRQGNSVFWLTCQYVDYDGTRFGTQKVNLNIPIFEGTRSITTLPTLPLEFHSNQDELKAKLIERGGKVENFAGSHYRAYDGFGWRLGNMGDTVYYTIKGRIVIDAYGWNRYQPNMPSYVTPFNMKDEGVASGVGSGIENTGEAGEIDEYDSRWDDVDSGMPLDGYFADEQDDETNRVALTDEQKMICTPLIRGYSFSEKQWLNFFVNAVHDITFSEEAFDSLVLPKNQKQLIFGFIETQQNSRTRFDDVIEGKGRGIILLLCGSPGVGKTLTAESVAEKMKVPLYMLTAGDLGLEPRQVENKLKNILELCTRWNAILLLDEADVFLEERSLHELERNKLVSIFLRVLEYFEGIMFLTTNRVRTFDAAFQSRIHISLEYPELDAKSRKAVWRNFLKQHDLAQAANREAPRPPLVSAAKHSRAKTTTDDDEKAKDLIAKTQPHAMSEKDIDKLSLLKLNGRQIKNILKIAQLLASQNRQGLLYEHIQDTMELTQHLHNETAENERTKMSVFS